MNELNLSWFMVTVDKDHFIVSATVNLVYIVIKIKVHVFIYLAEFMEAAI